MDNKEIAHKVIEKRLPYFFKKRDYIDSADKKYRKLVLGLVYDAIKETKKQMEKKK